MENKHMGWWWVAAVVVGGGLAYYLLQKTTAKPPVKTPPPPGTGSTGPAPGSYGGPPVGQGNAPNTADNSAIGLTAYSWPLTVIRSSPQQDNGWLGIGGNTLTSISDSGISLGAVLAKLPDAGGATNSTGAVYTWYQINPSSTIDQNTGGNYYVRSDQITVK